MYLLVWETSLLLLRLQGASYCKWWGTDGVREGNVLELLLGSEGITNGFGKDALSPGMAEEGSSCPWAGNSIREGGQPFVSPTITSSVTAAAVFAAPASA